MSCDNVYHYNYTDVVTATVININDISDNTQTIHVPETPITNNDNSITFNITLDTEAST